MFAKVTNNLCSIFKHNLFSRSVGVSNFGVQHLEGIKEAGLPAPTVNQIELHPFWRLQHVVNYCHDNGIAVMGYCPIIRARKNNEPLLVEMAARYVLHFLNNKHFMQKRGIKYVFVFIFTPFFLSFSLKAISLHFLLHFFLQSGRFLVCHKSNRKFWYSINVCWCVEHCWFFFTFADIKRPSRNCSSAGVFRKIT